MRPTALALLLFGLVAGCAPEPTLGRFCAHTTDCGSPLICRLGRCRSECVQNQDCPAGERCLLDPGGLGACSFPVDVCSAGATCPRGLTCADDVCSNACTTVAQCPPDAICAPATDGTSRCALANAPDAGSDGGP